MRTTRKRLRRLTYSRPTGGAAPVARGLDEERWAQLPESAGPLPDPVDPTQLPFAPPDYGAAYAALKQFYERSPCQVHLNAETGLPSFLSGQLQEPQPDATPLEAAERFLRTQELMLTGRHAGTQVTRVRETDWRDGTYQILFLQTNRSNLPVYGGAVACTFNADGWLVLVTSTLYPVTAAEIDFYPDKELSLAELEMVIAEQVPPEVGWGGLAPPPRVDGEAFRKELVERRTILPYYRAQGEAVDAPTNNRKRVENRWLIPPEFLQEKDEIFDPESAAYRPVVNTPFRGSNDDYWLAFVDEERNQLLGILLNESSATKPAIVFPRTQHAQMVEPLLEPGDLQTLASFNLTRILDLGHGATTFAAAQRVHLRGARLREPDDPTINESDRLRFLGANIFFSPARSSRLFS